jgi:hypothetical protein
MHWPRLARERLLVHMSFNDGTRVGVLNWLNRCMHGSLADHCYDEQIRSTADAMKSNGMGELGFEWIVLDGESVVVVRAVTACDCQ